MERPARSSWVAQLRSPEVQNSVAKVGDQPQEKGLAIASARMSRTPIKAKRLDPVAITSRAELFLCLLASSEPLDKLGQSHREGCPTHVIGLPQPLAQVLKGMRSKQWVRRGVNREGKCHFWGVGRQQNLHQEHSR